MARTHFGVQVSTAMCSIDELRSAWRRAEELGFDWISGQDHFYTLRDPQAPQFEALTSHTALACETTRVRVGCLVYSAGYRHPAVMAAALSTIDRLSGGRLEVGIGAGWLQAEYEDYGMVFEPPAVRLRRLREAVQVIRLLWTQDVSDFDGEFYTLRQARSRPKPVQTLPRIWIGGKGERALRLAAEIGDGWNAQFVDPDAFATKADVVRRHAPDPSRFAIGASAALVVADGSNLDAVMAHRYGPAAADIKGSALAGSIAQVTDKVGAFVEAGAEWIIVALRPPFELDELAAFAEHVIPGFR